MKKFRKLVEAGYIGLQPWAEEELKDYASEIIHYDRLPGSEEELVAWIGDADAVLVRNLPLVPALYSQGAEISSMWACAALSIQRKVPTWISNMPRIMG